MKKIFVMAVVAAALFTSCGTTKTATTDYQYEQWKAQQQSTPQRPARTMRTLDPCIELAQEDSENWRAYGTATSYVEKVALNEAQRDAINRLAQMMKVAVEGAAQDYEQNAQQNMKGSAETLGEQVFSQFVAQEITNTKTIKTSIYDLADGSVQVYVCIEMRTDKDEFNKKLNNTLDREGIIGIQYDRDRFIQKMSAGLEEYKKKNQAQ